MPGEVSNPSETLLIVDAGYALINWWHVTLEPPRALNPTFIENTSYIPGMNINSEKTIWQGLENDAVLGRHQNKTVNIGFVDGHVKREDADECLIKKTQKELVYKTSLWSPK